MTTPEKITHQQVLAVSDILGLDPNTVSEVRIDRREVEVTHLDFEASRGTGPIVKHVHTYHIVKEPQK